MKRFIIKLIDGLIFIAAIVIILLAVLLSVSRALLPHLLGYQERIRVEVSTALHHPVAFTDMQAGWRGFEPELQFTNVAIRNPENTTDLLNINELDVGIDLLKSLFARRFMVGTVVISGATLSVVQDSTGKLIINEINKPTPTPTPTETDFNPDAVLRFLFSANQIYVNDVDVSWHGKNGIKLLFKNVDLKLTNKLLSHQLLGAAVLQKDTITVPFHLVLNCQGNSFSSPNFKALLYLHVKRLVLASWLKNKPLYGITATSGAGDVKFWLTWKKQKLQNIQTEFAMQNVGLQAKNFKHPLLFPLLGANLFWQSTNEGWNIAGKDIVLAITNANHITHSWPITQFSFNYITPLFPLATGSQTLQLSYASLDDIKQVLINSTSLPATFQQWLQQLNPTGELQELTMNHEGALTTLGDNWNLITKFQGLGWQRWQKIPGAAHLTGIIRLDPNEGTLNLEGKKLTLDFGSLFHAPLPLDELSGDFNWQKNADGWEIHGNNVIAENALVAINGVLSVFIPNDKTSPLLNFLAGFSIQDPAKALQYQPVGIMHKALLDWLHQANLTGNGIVGNVVFSGPLHAFPFKANEGRFIVDSQLQNISLHYAKGWPVIKGINGELIFDDDSMSIHANSGTSLNAKIDTVNGRIPDLTHAVLEVNGDISSNLNDGLQFLQQSPLNASIGSKLKDFQLKGPMQVNLQMSFPLDHDGESTVLGNVAIQDGDVKLPQWWNLHATDVQGNLQFTENTLSGNLQASLFNQPLHVQIATLQNKGQPSITQIDLGDHQATLQQLQQEFNFPSIKYLQGGLKYHALLRLQNSGTAPSTLTLTSDLQGTTVTLPAPLGKSADQIIPSQVQLGFGGDRPLQILGAYGNILSAALTYKTNQGIQNGELRFGGKPAVFQTLPGLLISGEIPSFAWDEWKPVFNSGLQDNKKKPALLRQVDLAVGELKVLGLTIANAKIMLQPLSELGGWQLGIDSPKIIGQLEIPADYSAEKSTLRGKFQRLYLASDTKDNNTTAQLKPADVPALDLSCDDLRLGERIFGHVEINTLRSEEGMSINRLHVWSTDYDLTATGQWIDLGKTQQTAITGQLNAKNLGTALNQWNTTKNLADGEGNANFNLLWDGPPYKPNEKTLSGKLSMKFYEGRILNLSKSTEAELGLGRVLNLFSMQTIPRRLRLDFSDLTDEGFSFDVMEGDFTLDQGNAVTENAYIKGAVAKVEIKGRIGLGNHDYDLEMLVTPYVTSSIPLIATVAGGPIAGAVAWVAGKILSPAIGQLITNVYKVSGTWDNPVIVKAGTTAPAPAGGLNE